MEDKEKMQKACDITFTLSWRKTGATVYKLILNGICYYFIENGYYCNRAELYGEHDDGERFAFFSTAVIEYMLQSGNIPDIIHANDWQTALTAIYLKTKYSDVELLRSVKTVYTIHNIEYQGKYSLDILEDLFGIDKSNTYLLEYNGCINLMKGGIQCADKVTTVSPTYANEILTPHYSHGLNPILERNQHKLCGIVNGIDTVVFEKCEGIFCYPLTAYGYGYCGRAGDGKLGAYSSHRVVDRYGQRVCYKTYGDIFLSAYLCGGVLNVSNTSGTAHSANVIANFFHFFTPLYFYV